MNRNISALVMLCAACGCATFPRETGQSMDRIEVIAHRGASAYAPENTLAAFELAVEQKADWYELDCHLAADGGVAVIHDGTTDRTTGAAGAVSAMTIPQLKTLDAGAWKDAAFAGEPIPTIEESFDMAKGRIGVYAEIKDQGGDDELIARILADAAGRKYADDAFRALAMRHIEASGSRNLVLTRNVIAAIRERGMEDEVVIQSFAPIVCVVAAVEAPEIRVEVLAVDDEKDPDIWERYLRFTYLFAFDGLNTNAKALTEGRLAALQTAGLTVAIWTVDKDEDLRKYASWGVDRIITNRPDACLSILAAMGLR